jgi:SAM-dependent methyltransferase
VRSPELVEALADASFDLIVMNSVAQYLSAEELDRALALFRRLLRPAGRLVLGDVIPPSVSPVADALALLRFAAANGFFLAALGGLARTAFSDYRKLRAKLGLAFYDEPAMLERLTAAGFTAARAPVNIGHNPARMSFVASPA